MEAIPRIMNHADDNAGVVFIPLLMNVTCVHRALYKGTMLHVGRNGHIQHEILFRPPHPPKSAPHEPSCDWWELLIHDVGP
jgi:hypothetical protein